MSPEEKKAPAQFSLLNVFITKAVYEFLGNEDFKLTDRPPKLNVSIQLTARVKLFGNQLGASVEIDAKMIPDQQWQPYRLEVRIGGVFQTADGTTDELLQFCKVAAPSILFPYIRETAHRLTMDAPGGVVRLDPMNVSMLLNQGPWTDGQTTDSEPNVPPQPSEQSASASPDSTPEP